MRQGHRPGNCHQGYITIPASSQKSCRRCQISFIFPEEMAARSSFCQRVCSSAERSKHKVKNTRRVYTARPELFWVRDQGGDNSGSVLLLYGSSGTQGECFSPSHLFHLISRGVFQTQSQYSDRESELRVVGQNATDVEKSCYLTMFFKYLVLVLGKFIKEVSYKYERKHDA